MPAAQTSSTPPSAPPHARSAGTARLRGLALTLALALAGAALAQVCEPELAAAFPADVLKQEVTGAFAASLLVRALELAEPALPQFAWGLPVDLAETDPAFPDVSFLANRRLVPVGWSPGPLDREVWQEMISELMGGMGWRPPWWPDRRRIRPWSRS